MEKEIKKIRVEIDGLAQLTKSLKEEVVVLDLSTIPNNQAVEEWLENYKNKLIIKNSTNTFKKTSKEIEKATDSLYLSKAWLGKLLGELGTENPYGSGYKTVEDIEPTADTNKFPHEIKFIDGEIHVNSGNGRIEWAEKNHIEKVDWLRQEINKVIKTFYSLSIHSKKESDTNTILIILENVFTHLCEARFWLGFELEKIKKENNE
jgi:hypothetical protein